MTYGRFTIYCCFDSFTQFVLSFLRRVTIALQSKVCNLVDAYNDVALARECIRDSNCAGMECGIELSAYLQLWGLLFKSQGALEYSVIEQMQALELFRLLPHKCILPFC